MKIEIEQYITKFTFCGKGWKKYSVIEMIDEKTILSTSIKFVEWNQ